MADERNQLQHKNEDHETENDEVEAHQLQHQLQHGTTRGASDDDGDDVEAHQLQK
jgi:hypothetical protein